MKYYFILLVFSIGNAAFSQKYSVNEKVALLQKKGIEIATEDIQNMNDVDFNILLKTNFDSYRNEKSDRKVQFVSGPQATLKSLNYCKMNNISFDDKVLNSKKNEVESQTTHSIVTKINIGLGYKQNELNPENY